MPPAACGDQRNSSGSESAGAFASGAGSVLAYGLSGSLLFFVVTNFAAWVGSSLYPPTFAGLMQSYAAGIPFFKWTVAGTFVYSAVLFGGFELLRHRVPGLSAGARAEA